MNRRDLLKGLFAFPVAGAVACAVPSTQESRQSSVRPAPGTLKVVIVGPFAAVIQPGKNFHVTAYIPHDREKQHEFRFQNPNRVMPADKAYDFTLSSQGLEPNQRQPYVDRGFDDFNVNIHGWPGAANYFVKIELPPPDVISFIPLSEPVIFRQNSRRGVMQLNMVLEYRASDLRQVCMFAGQGKDCLKPMSCEELYEHYETYWKAEKKDQSHSRQTEDDLSKCAHSQTSAYFFGVGLPPHSRLNYNDDHALHFFNETLLPSLGKDPVLQTKILQKLGKPGDPCAPVAALEYAPSVTPAVFRMDNPRPRLLTVASAEDCRVGGMIATTQP